MNEKSDMELLNNGEEETHGGTVEMSRDFIIAPTREKSARLVSKKSTLDGQSSGKRFKDFIKDVRFQSIRGMLLKRIFALPNRLITFFKGDTRNVPNKETMDGVEKEETFK